MLSDLAEPRPRYVEVGGLGLEVDGGTASGHCIGKRNGLENPLPVNDNLHQISPVANEDRARSTRRARRERCRRPSEQPLA
jgi:hypothetical protein